MTSKGLEVIRDRRDLLYDSKAYVTFVVGLAYFILRNVKHFKICDWQTY